MTLPSGHPALGQPDLQLLDEVAAALDLREPNRDAVHAIALHLHRHGAAGADGCFEGVVDAATGMGKSYVVAAAIDYFAAMGIANFAIVTPGSTIQAKTLRQFAAGTPKSLLGGMRVEPLLVHAGNFRSAAVARELERPDRVKLFVFTVQSLIKPTSRQGRRTHAFQEGLGGAFYEHLTELDDLIVFADEYHAYSGRSFSAAVRGLDPLALIGLTATPSRRSDAIIFRYPLAAAIAERYVKTPVIVGRKDDRTDERAQLLDGVALLQAKERIMQIYCREYGAAPVHPIMLVNCADIAHARATVALLRSAQVAGGRFAADGAVLEVHSAGTSEERERALGALERAEEPGSPTRIIVQVGMLKEGWDVKSVYVIVSLRASVSDVLTEQTLGRGLRLPFGRYVPDEYQLLNELEVVAHERYQDLLRRSNVLTEAFVGTRTQLVAAPIGQEGPWTLVEQAVAAPVVDAPLGSLAPDALPEHAHALAGSGLVGVASTEDRRRELELLAAADPEPLAPREPVGALRVPVTKQVAAPGRFSLQDVTDPAPFRDLGRRLAVDPERYLARRMLSGRIVTDHVSGEKRAQLASTEASTRVEAAAAPVDPADARAKIVRDVVASRVVTSRPQEAAQVDRLLDYVLEGAGEKSDVLLANYPSRLVAGLVERIVDASRQIVSQRTQYTEVVASQLFQPRPRMRRTRTSADRYGRFHRGTAYEGWAKSLFAQAWFDSSPERDLANVLDADDEVEVWVRLHVGDLPILWNGAERAYNPDFLLRTRDGTQWIAEVKADRDMPTSDVRAKRHAALAWANAVNASGAHGRWEYLLVAERDLVAARGSWSALVALTRA